MIRGRLVSGKLTLYYLGALTYLMMFETVLEICVDSSIIGLRQYICASTSLYLIECMVTFSVIPTAIQRGTPSSMASNLLSKPES